MSDFEDGRSMANVRTIEAFRAERRATEARWLELMRARLVQGPASTRQLADVCGINRGREFARFRGTIYRSGFIVRDGETIGATGHINIVWKMAE